METLTNVSFCSTSFLSRIFYYFEGQNIVVLSQVDSLVN